MVGVMLDHYIFKSRRFTPKTKWIVFGSVVFAVVGTFWLFRACAWGIEGAHLRGLVRERLLMMIWWAGPATDMKGRKWRAGWNIY